MSKMHLEIKYSKCVNGWNSNECKFRTVTDNSNITEIFRTQGLLNEEESLGHFHDDDIKALIVLLNKL